MMTTSEVKYIKERAVVWTTLAVFCGIFFATSQQALATPPEEQERYGPSGFKYVGAFRLPLSTFGDSRLGYAQGTIALNSNNDNDSFFVIGHAHHLAIAEFTIPELVNSSVLNNLNMAQAPIQNFESILNRIPGGNADGLDRLTGMEIINGALVINATEAYDGDTNNKDTTFIIREPSQLATSAIDGFFEFDSGSHASGWISKIPQEWQPVLNGGHVTGFASNYSINSRNSMGPSAFLFDPVNLLNVDPLISPSIKTTRLLDFSVDHRLSTLKIDDNPRNVLWTDVSKANYGFIIPHTRTYATIGSSGGHESGVGYKITQDNGKLCSGPCSYEAKDNYNYLWLWDVNDLVKVKSGLLEAYNVRPYWHGKFPAPFQNYSSLGYALIIGADYDEVSKRLYLLLGNVDRLQSKYERAPVMVVYEVTYPPSSPTTPSVK